MLNDIFAFKKIKEGDIKTFEYVFRQHYPPLCLYAFSIIGQRESAEEIVQELFYTIWKDRENIQIARSLKSYLYAAVRNQALQYHEQWNVRERHREKTLNEKGKRPELTPQEQMEYKELECVIDQALGKLPSRRSEIFKMHRMEGKKYKEIAEHFSVSVKTIEAEMTKAYQLLRQEIEKYTKLFL